MPPKGIEAMPAGILRYIRMYIVQVYGPVETNVVYYKNT